MALADVITDVRRLVQDEPWEDYLSAGYTAAAATVSVANPTGWEEGAVMDFPVTGQQMRVKVTPTVNPISVALSHNSTTNQNESNGAVVYRDPRFGTDQISKMVEHVVETRLWPDLWIVATASLTPLTTTMIYDLPADYEDFVALAQVRAGSVEDLIYMNRVDELLNVPAAVSATGKALRVDAWGRMDVAATLFYRARPTVATMTSAMEPIIAYGTASMLLRTEMAEKTDRFDEDDRTGRGLRNARELERLFDEEKRRMRAVLMPQWGQRRRFHHASGRRVVL